MTKTAQLVCPSCRTSYIGPKCGICALMARIRIKAKAIRRDCACAQTAKRKRVLSYLGLSQPRDV